MLTNEMPGFFPEYWTVEECMGCGEGVGDRWVVSEGPRCSSVREREPTYAQTATKSITNAVAPKKATRPRFFFLFGEGGSTGSSLVLSGGGMGITGTGGIRKPATSGNATEGSCCVSSLFPGFNGATGPGTSVRLFPGSCASVPRSISIEALSRPRWLSNGGVIASSQCGV